MTFALSSPAPDAARDPGADRCSRSRRTVAAPSSRSRSRTSTCWRGSRPRAPPGLAARSSRSRSSCSRSLCAAGALARPSVQLSQPDQNATIMLLVDVSGSMRANDVEPTRLDAAVAAMRTFLDRLPSQFKVGLVAFSSEPEPLVSPTSNRDVLRQSIALLEPEAGTAVGDGIGVAVQMLRSLAPPGRATSASPASRCPPRSCSSPTAPRTAASCSPSRRRGWRSRPGSASTRCLSGRRRAR